MDRVDIKTTNNMFNINDKVQSPCNMGRINVHPCIYIVGGGFLFTLRTCGEIVIFTFAFFHFKIQPN